MKKTHKGFTLIELVIVIVILGILAAVAIPKFVDLSGEASTAATEGVAATLSSATSINYAKRKLNPSAATVVNNANVCSVAVLQPFVTGVTLVGGTPATSKEFKISGNGDCSGTAEYVTCQLQGRDAPSAVDVLIQCAR